MKGIRASVIIGGAGWIMIMVAGCYLDSPGKAAYIAAGIVVIGMLLLLIGSRLMDRAEALERERRRREYARQKRAAEREVQRKAQRDMLFFHWCNDCGCSDLGYPADDLNSR